MAKRFEYDAVVVGSGPNGLAAAIRIAEEGHKVLVMEAAEQPGGGARSDQATLPGFVHDLCSAVHPFGRGSPFFKRLPLERYGLRWVDANVPLAHPLEQGEAVLLDRSVDDTAAGLGEDAPAYRRLMAPLTAKAPELAEELLRPIFHLPAHPLALAQFGARAVRSANGLANKCFKAEPARALFAGLAAHSFMDLDDAPSASFGLVLGLFGHAAGWPFPAGGAGRIANALIAHLRTMEGELITQSPVKSLDELPLARAVLLDITPRQLLALAGARLPDWYRRKLEKYRYGPGIFKIDYALSCPIPWRNQQCARAGTVHVGGSLEEIATAEREVAKGHHPERPFILLAQPSLFDPARAPKGKHVAWAYCHVPNGSSFDMTERFEKQIERFAPGFRDCILGRRVLMSADIERKNPNLVGGDINGGANDWRQLLCRPVFSANPYRLPIPGMFLCSSSTPPGGGVHGMCGFNAAEAALKWLRRA